MNQDWIRRCAYRLYEIMRDFQAISNPRQNWEWAQEIAQANPGRSRQSGWAKTDDEIVWTEFVHRVYLGLVKA